MLKLNKLKESNLMVQSLPWYILLLISIVFFTILFFIRRTFYKIIPRQVEIVDLIPPVMVLNLHFISFQITEWSIVPYLMLVWLTLLFAFILYKWFFSNNFKLRNVFLIYWRIWVLILPVIYIIFVLLHLFSLL